VKGDRGEAHAGAGRRDSGRQPGETASPDHGDSLDPPGPGQFNDG